MTSTGPITVGILYPMEWFGDAEAVAAEVAAIEALDPRIAVVVAPYVEPHELRNARGSEPQSAWEDLIPDLTDSQRDAIAKSSILLALDVPVNVTDISPNLQWIQAVGAGTDQFGPCDLAAANVELTSNGGANATGIAEFAFGRLIEANKHFVAMRELQNDRTWEPMFGEQLAGKRLGLIGYGAIASAIAHRARAFGMEIHVVRSSTTPTPDVAAQYSTEQLHDMLGAVDAVISAVPESPATTGLMDEAAFAAMKPGAFFCNVGRGTLVDEPALIAGLESGHIGSAALDVASVEPLPADHELWAAPNLSLSYHCSSVPTAMFINVHQTFRHNIELHLQAQPLNHLVT